MSRDLRTSRSQVFGEVSKGTECRVCGRSVDDGRRKTCSEYCNNLVSAVMGLLNWRPVRRHIIERDEKTCQACGYDQRRHERANAHIRERIEALAGEQPAGVGLLALGRGEVSDAELRRDRRASKAYWRAKAEAKRRYGDPYETPRDLEVDHIQPLADGGHPFDPANLRTLCSDCHGKKTARENSERHETPTPGELSESLFEFVGSVPGGDGG